MSRLYTPEMVEAVAHEAYNSLIFEKPSYRDPNFRTRVLEALRRHGLPQGSQRSYQTKKGRFRG